MTAPGQRIVGNVGGSAKQRILPSGKRAVMVAYRCIVTGNVDYPPNGEHHLVDLQGVAGDETFFQSTWHRVDPDTGEIVGFFAMAPFCNGGAAAPGVISINGDGYNLQPGYTLAYHDGVLSGKGTTVDHSGSGQTMTLEILYP
jgi:hypothetical protein